MRTTHASLSNPFDSSPILFPESTHTDATHVGVLVAEAPASPGSWRYQGGRYRRRLPWGSMCVSAGLLAFLLLGLNRKPQVKVAVVEEPVPILTIELAPLPPEAEEVTDSEVTPDPGEGVDVPQLADFPGVVTLDTTFVQHIDFRSMQPNVAIDGARLAAIPANIGTGHGGGGIVAKDIFNLNDLDRAPSAVLQPMPTIPPSLRGEQIQVVVMVEFILSAKGEVVDVRVVRSTDSRFNDVATSAVYRWKFKPGYKKGRPVASRLRQPMTIQVTPRDD